MRSNKGSLLSSPGFDKGMRPYKSSQRGRIEPLGFVYIARPLSTVCFYWFTGVAGASFGVSHGEWMGLEEVEKRVESVSC